MNRGFEVVDNVIDEEQCNQLIEALPDINASGTRTLLDIPIFVAVVERCRSHYRLTQLIGRMAAVQCTYFRKSQENNWAIRLHRDRVVPLRGKGPWKGSGVKEGMNFVEPPNSFLSQCLAVRINLDSAMEGDLSVVPDTHDGGTELKKNSAISVPVPKGGALVMRPTLGHASSKLANAPYRRVLHYLFAPTQLPDSYGWYHAT